MKYGKMLKIMNGLYQVSNLGRVISLNYNKTNQQKILKVSFDKNGYTSLNLCKEGKIFHRTIHRLVAEAFIPNLNNYPCVNHKDENPRNNNVDNLEWCTYQYNMNYGTCAERRNKSNKISINQYDKSNNFIKQWASAIDIQNETGINQASIIKCCRNKLKTAGGFIWKYEDIRETSKKNLIQRINELTKQLEIEKEKNKELERELAKREWVKIKDNGEVEPLFYISKDKIERIIDKIYNKYEDISEVKNDLEELLEESEE